MFDPLVHREDREVPGSCEPAMIGQGLQGTQHRDRTIGAEVQSVHKVRTGQVQRLLGDAGAAVLQQALGIVAEQLGDR